MLRRALENYPSVTGFVENLTTGMERIRNKKEVKLIARVIDFNIDQLGVDIVRELHSTEVLMRRMAAIVYAEENNNNWAVASHIEEGDTSLLSDKQKRRMLSSARLEQRIQASASGTAQGGTSQKKKSVDKGEAGGG